MKLIFAQGNPEERYAPTRHNVGWQVLDVLAKQENAPWKLDKKHNAFIATTVKSGEKVLFVKPLSYYNETGRVARSLVHFYKCSAAEDLLVIHDDLALPFGTIRTREQGSDAGNNGVKSLNAHLGQDYSRIRIGVWNEHKAHMNDADFVLSSFSQTEQAALTTSIIPAVVAFTDAFIENRLAAQSISL